MNNIVFHANVPVAGAEAPQNVIISAGQEEQDQATTAACAVELQECTLK